MNLDTYNENFIKEISDYFESTYEVDKSVASISAKLYVNCFNVLVSKGITTFLDKNIIFMQDGERVESPNTIIEVWCLADGYYTVKDVLNILVEELRRSISLINSKENKCRETFENPEDPFSAPSYSPQVCKEISMGIVQKITEA